MLIPLPNRIEFGVEMSDTPTNCQVGLDFVSRPCVCYLRSQMIWRKILSGRLRCVAHIDPLYSS